MNYIQLIDRILHAAIAETGISTAFEGDIYQVNIMEGKDYPVFCVSPTQPQVERENHMEHHLTFYYVDREMRASSQIGNPDISSIHSRGMEALRAIIARLRYDADILDIPYDISYVCWSDTEIFADKCAGAYADVTILVAKETNCAL